VVESMPNVVPMEFGSSKRLPASWIASIILIMMGDDSRIDYAPVRPVQVDYCDSLQLDKYVSSPVSAIP
jgi:hypothetical protein